MAHPVVEKLKISLDALERSIEATKSTLLERDNAPIEVLRRVDQYTQMVEKQRKLANHMEQMIHDQKWDEVSRSIKLINGLSQMIREDAESVTDSQVHFEVQEKKVVGLNS